MQRPTVSTLFQPCLLPIETAYSLLVTPDCCVASMLQSLQSAHSSVRRPANERNTTTWLGFCMTLSRLLDTLWLHSTKPVLSRGYSQNSGAGRQRPADYNGRVPCPVTGTRQSFGLAAVGLFQLEALRNQAPCGIPVLGITSHGRISLGWCSFCWLNL